MSGTRYLTLTLLVIGAVAVVLVVFGVTGRGEAASQVVPANTAAPTIAGQPVVGEILNANRGTWTGTEPITYVYQWQRCNTSGGTCLNITVGTQPTYTVSSGDLAETLRVQVTATNADGSASAVSAPTDRVVQPQVNITGCPPVQEAGPLTMDEITPPARLLIDRQTVTPAVITRDTRRITLRFHVVACDGRKVVGALVYATPTPYQQFSGTEKVTGQDGWATLTMNRLRSFPASSKQQLLVVFARARKPGTGTEELLGGISTRRLVSFPVRLNG